MEQSDGTFVAWAGPDESVGVDYVEDTPEHAQAAAMFALKRKESAAPQPAGRAAAPSRGIYFPAVACLAITLSFILS